MTVLPAGRLTSRFAAVIGLVLASVVFAMPRIASPAQAQVASPIPVLAYYYQWFDTSSWSRAKIDYPALGRYSSDDPNVMREQIREAKAAGITGFIVSWKDTPTNDSRLRALMAVARTEQFKLAMIYQGLDFSRKPQPTARVAADFKMFRDQFAADPVFLRMGGKPLTIWSGTWAFSHDDVASVTTPVRSSMLVLSTEKSVSGYKRLADVTDGDAYYWSSVNPQTNTGYQSKLSDFSKAAHADGKYWIAPFAPGFDARLVGGTQSVQRNNGATLRAEYATAVNSSPDALGLISWNEFSENTYVEPSQKYGDLYLNVLKSLVTTPVSASTSGAASGPDSSGPETPDGSHPASLAKNVSLLLGPLFLVALGATALAWRRRRGRSRVSAGRDRLDW